MQWLKFRMVTTEMVSSADNTARGFLPVTEGSLAAGQDAISSQVFENIVSSRNFYGFWLLLLDFTAFWNYKELLTIYFLKLK